MICARWAGSRLFPAEIFTDGDKLHFRCNDALAGILELSHDFAGFRSKGLALQGKGDCGVTTSGDRSVRWLDFIDISARHDPLAPERRQSSFDFAVKIGVPPGSGAVINPGGLVRFDLPGVRFSRAEIDLAKRDPDIGM